MISAPKILIIRLSSIGDILLTTPFLRQVRSTFPDSQIDYVVKEQFKQLLLFNKNISNLISFNTTEKYKGLKKLNSELIENSYDYVFDLHNNFRSLALTKGFKNGKITRIKKEKLKRFLLTKFKINTLKNYKHVVEKYLLVGAEAGVKDDDLGLEFFFGDEVNENIKRVQKEFDLLETQYLCVAPGAAHFTKQWPAEYLKEVIKKIISNLKMKVVLLGTKPEKDLINTKDFPEGSIINMCGELDLLNTAGIILHSKGVLCNDSGLMHLAAALKKPIFAIFGSTVEELGFFPYKADSVVFQNLNLECRPCSHIGRSNCPKGHFKCMREINPQKVFSVIEKKMKI